MEKNLEQRIVLSVNILQIILGQKKWKWQAKFLEKNVTVLFVDQVGWYFKTKTQQ